MSKKNTHALGNRRYDAEEAATIAARIEAAYPSTPKASGPVARHPADVPTITKAADGRTIKRWADGSVERTSANGHTVVRSGPRFRAKATGAGAATPGGRALRLKALPVEEALRHDLAKAQARLRRLTEAEARVKACEAEVMRLARTEAEANHDRGRAIRLERAIAEEERRAILRRIIEAGEGS